MRWVKDSLVAKARANPTLAAWCGTDTLGKVRFYFQPAPSDNDMFADPKSVGTVANPLRYMTFEFIGSPPPDWDWNNNRDSEYTIQVNSIDKSDGSPNNCLAGLAVFAAIFEPAAAGQLDGLITNPEPAFNFHCRAVLADGDPRQPERDEDGVWISSQDWRVLIERSAA